jgi:hypothetical protein
MAIKEIRTDPDSFREDFARKRVDSDLAELGDLITPERFAAELEMRRKLCAGIEHVLKLIAQVKGFKKKLSSASSSLPRAQIAIDRSRHPTWSKSYNWGHVRLITTKRRR